MRDKIAVVRSRCLLKKSQTLYGVRGVRGVVGAQSATLGSPTSKAGERNIDWKNQQVAVTADLHGAQLPPKPLTMMDHVDDEVCQCSDCTDLKKLDTEAHNENVFFGIAGVAMALIAWSTGGAE